MSVSPKHIDKKSVSNQHSDLIERSKAIEALEKLRDGMNATGIDENFISADGVDEAIDVIRALPSASVTDEMATELFHIARTGFLYMAHKELGHVLGGELFRELAWPENTPRFVDGRLEEIRAVLEKYEPNRAAMGHGE